MPRTIEGKYVTKSSQVFQEGDNAWLAGDYDTARNKYRDAAKLYLDSGDDEGAAFVYSRLGELELSQYNYESANLALNTALMLAKKSENAENTYGEILIRLSKVRTAQLNYNAALDLVHKAEQVLDEIGNRNLSGDAYEHEAYIQLMMGNDTAALKAYKTAAQLFESERVTLKEAAVLRSLARLEMRRKNYDEAHEILEKCRALYRENGDLLGEASALSAIGSLRFLIGDIPNARKALMKSVYLYGKAGHNFAEAEALLYLARVEASNQEQGSYPRARAHYKHSIELYDFMQNDIMKHAVLEEYQNFLNKTGYKGD